MSEDCVCELSDIAKVSTKNDAIDEEIVRERSWIGDAQLGPGRISDDEIEVKEPHNMEHNDDENLSQLGEEAQEYTASERDEHCTCTVTCAEDNVGSECCTNKTCLECSSSFTYAHLFENTESAESTSFLRVTQSTAGGTRRDSLSVVSLPSPAPTQRKCSTVAGEPPWCQFCEYGPVSVVCDDCTMNKCLCMDCFVIRHKKPSMQSHTSHTWSPSLGATLCPLHGLECLMFCRHDHAVICILCTNALHKGHATALISEEIVCAKDRVQTVCRLLEITAKELQTNIDTMKAQCVELTGLDLLDKSMSDRINDDRGGTSHAVVAAINDRFDKLRDLLEGRRRELIDSVGVLCDRKITAWTERMDAIHENVTLTQTLCVQAKHTLQHQSDVYILANERALTTSLSGQLGLLHSLGKVSTVTSNMRFIQDGVEDADIQALGVLTTDDVDVNQCKLRNIDTLRHRMIVHKELNLIVELYSHQDMPVPCRSECIMCVITSSQTDVMLPTTANSTVSVRDNGDGCYTLSWIIDTPGEYVISIKVGGVDVYPTPCLFNVVSRLTEGFIGDGDHLQNPYGICYHDGLLFVCDINHHQVRVFGCDGSFKSHIGAKGSKAGQLWNPFGICYHDNSLFVCDQSNHRIQVFKCDGSYVRAMGSSGSGEGQLHHPCGICCYNGLLYVCDYGNDRIQVFGPDGSYIRCIGGKDTSEPHLHHPHSICCHENLLYICHQSSHSVLVYKCDGSYIKSIGRSGSGTGQLLQPSGICCYDGLLYICDYGNHRIQVFECEGSYVTSIKSGGPNNLSIGRCTVNMGPDKLQYYPTTKHKLHYPQGICAYDGLLYVCDYENRHVRILPVHVK